MVWEVRPFGLQQATAVRTTVRTRVRTYLSSIPHVVTSLQPQRGTFSVLGGWNLRAVSSKPQRWCIADDSAETLGQSVQK